MSLPLPIIVSAPSLPVASSTLLNVSVPSPVASRPQVHVHRTPGETVGVVLVVVLGCIGLGAAVIGVVALLSREGVVTTVADHESMPSFP